MNTISIKYTSYAIAPDGISIGKTYSLEKDKKGYYISDIETKQYLDFEIIKMLFTPVEKAWEEITL